MKTIFLLALATMASTVAMAEPIVITNPGLHLSSSEVIEVYLGSKQFAGATKIVPIDNAQAQANFEADVLKIDSNKYKKVWAKKAFQEGITPPETKNTDLEVFEFVKRTPGAVGYLSTNPGKSGVNIVQQ